MRRPSAPGLARWPPPPPGSPWLRGHRAPLARSWGPGASGGARPGGRGEERSPSGRGPGVPGVEAAAVGAAGPRRAPGEPGGRGAGGGNGPGRSGEVDAVCKAATQGLPGAAGVWSSPPARDLEALTGSREAGVQPTLSALKEMEGSAQVGFESSWVSASWSRALLSAFLKSESNPGEGINADPGGETARVRVDSCACHAAGLRRASFCAACALSELTRSFGCRI